MSAADERWASGPVWQPSHFSMDMDFDALERALGQLVEIEDSGTLGSLLEVEHGLGRVPSVVRIGKIQVGSGYTMTNPVQAWKREDDPADTERLFYVRISPASSRVLMEVR